MTQGLRQLAQQLAETWKHLGVNQRVSLVLGTGVVLAGLLGVTLWSSRPDFVLLYGKLDDSEAAKVMAALDDAKARVSHRSIRSVNPSIPTCTRPLRTSKATRPKGPSSTNTKRRIGCTTGSFARQW